MRLFLLLIISVSLLFVVSCKPDKQECHDPSNKDCDNYDPCYGQNPVKAEILLAQKGDLGAFVGEYVVYINEDNRFPKTEIRFSCPLEGAKYTWTLGAETISSQTFERNFFSVPFGSYSVKLIVEKAPNKQCFPTDDGLDTFIKTFEIVPVCSLAITGVFKGKWDNSILDSGLISLRSFNTSINSFDSCTLGAFRLTNLQGKNDTLEAFRGIISNQEFINYHPNHAGIGNANFKINLSDNTVLFDYYIGSKHYVFRGRKYSN
ncbi:hypothetical protein QQ054_36225 [Oscillatoria amoena NRMC-F 0135]|nr:hypothetical protein [Oscillatoria amoena NRMC-F 0135]